MSRKKTKSAGRTPKKTDSFLEKSQVGISLTSHAVENLNKIVAETGLTKSKVVESLVTGNLTIASAKNDQAVAIGTDSQNEAKSSIANKKEVAEDVPAVVNQAKTSKKSVDESAVLTELKGKIQEHKASFKALRIKSQTQQETIKKLEKEIVGLKSSEIDKAELDNNIEQLLNQEIEQLKQQLVQHKNSEASSQKQISEKDSAITKLEEQLAAKQKEVDGANSDREGIQQQVSEKESAIANLQQQLTKANSKSQNLQVQTDDAQKQVGTLRNEIQQQQQEIDGLRAESKTSQNLITSKQVEIKNFEQQINQQKVQISEQNDASKKIQQRLTEQEQQNNTLSQQLSTVESSLKQTQTQLTEMSKQKEQQRNNLQQETVKNSQLTSQVSQSNSLIEQLNQKLATEKQNYGLLDLKGNEQSSLIDSLRTQLEEQTSLLDKQGTSGTYKTWTIILLGILLTISSALSVNSYIF